MFADKGNKAGNKNLAKYIAWYDSNLKRVRKYLLDVDCCDEDFVDSAVAIEAELRRVWPPEMPIRLYGQCTDSGGGGTLFSLARDLKKLHLCAPEYFVDSCSLHDLQTALRNAAEQVLGVGRTDENSAHMQTAMQMLHGCYNLQNWHETDELKNIFEFVVKQEGLSNKYVSLPEPVMTRWWLVGACACTLKDTVVIWKRLLQGLLTHAKLNSEVCKLASTTLGLMRQPVIRCDHELICAFHDWFLSPHFKYLQRG